MKKISRYLILLSVVLLILASIFSSVLSKNLPFIYLYILNGKTFDYVHKKYKLSDNFFFSVNDGNDFRYVVTSLGHVDKEQIVVYFPGKIDFKSLIEKKLIIQEKEISADCMLLKAVGNDDEYLVNNIKLDVMISINNQYLEHATLESLCLMIQE